MKNKIGYKIIFNEQDEYSIYAIKEIKILEKRKKRACKEQDFVKGAMCRDIQEFLTRMIKKRR